MTFCIINGKAEIMLFSNTDIPKFNITFNGRIIPITILTNIWELHLTAMLNGMYMLKICCQVFTNT